MSKFNSCIFLLIAFIFLNACASPKHATQISSVKHITGLHKKQMGALVEFAGKQINMPYQWGGNTPKGFDCSGFTTYCYAHFGVILPRTAIEQSESGRRVRSRKAKTGDLIFFKGSNKKHKKVAHVGIVVSGKKRDIKFIHAGSHGVTVSALKEEYFRKRFTGIRRLRK